MTLGQYLKQAREAKQQLPSLSLRGAAKILGISAAFLSDVERGTRMPSKQLMIDMSHLYGVALRDIEAQDPRPSLKQMAQLTVKVDNECSCCFCLWRRTNNR